MKSTPAGKACAILAILLIAVVPSVAAGEGRFFLRATAGPSFPSLENLNNELAIQGSEKVAMGYSGGVSLGRTFMDDQWSIEAHFSAAFYPDFSYKNDIEDSTIQDENFTGKLSHNNFMGIVRRHWRTESKWFKPSLGAGVGYGLTNLIAGGGKIGALEWLGVFRVDSAIKQNMSLAIEAVYHAGLQTKAFKSPFLENFEDDVVNNSAGDPLEDKYGSFDVRIGITVWLKQRWPQ